MLYRICLPKYSMVGEKLISQDHWVSVKANNEWEAKTKAIHKIAMQMLNGDSSGNRSEHCFVLTHTPLRSIKADIDIADLQVGE